jgi:uncharacterized delta-60 repeat protein
MTKRRVLYGIVFVLGSYALGAAAAPVRPMGQLDREFAGGVIRAHPTDDGAEGLAGLLVDSQNRVTIAGWSDVFQAGGRITYIRYLPDGRLDPSFGSGGIVLDQFGPNGQFLGLSAVAAGPAGSIISAGLTELGYGVARLRPDGSFDTSFGSGGVGEVDPGYATEVNRVAVAPDGKILVAGRVNDVQHASGGYALVRFNADGSLDRSFGSNGVISGRFGWPDYVRGLVVQPDGKPVLMLKSESVANLVLRYLPDGTLDPSFGTNGVAEVHAPPPTDLALAPNGDLIVAGGGDNGSAEMYAAAFLPNGEPDRAFGKDGMTVVPPWRDPHPRHQPSNWADTVTVQPDGKVVLAGENDGGDATCGNSELARFLPNGRLDPNFGNQGLSEIAWHGGGDCFSGFEFPVGLGVGPNGSLTVAGRALGDGTGWFVTARWLGGPSCAACLTPSTSPSMTEVPATGEDHRRAGSFDRFDHFVVPLGATGLDHRGHAGAER